MLNVLLHIMQNYNTPDNCPTVDVLYKHLSDAGFMKEEIDDAIDWLILLTDTCEQYTEFRHDNAIRVFTEREYNHLGVECIQHLQSLTEDDLPYHLKEAIINCCMEISTESLTIDNLKLLILLVMWNQCFTVDTHTINELVAAKKTTRLH